MVLYCLNSKREFFLKLEIQNTLILNFSNKLVVSSKLILSIVRNKKLNRGKIRMNKLLLLLSPDYEIVL